MTTPFPVDPQRADDDERPHARTGLTRAQKAMSAIGIALVAAVAVVALKVLDSPDVEDDAAEVIDIETTAVDATVTEGDLEFTVGNVEQGLVEILNGAGETRAEGEYVIVELTVRNLDDEVFDVFSASDQKLFDTDGNEYAADADAAAILLGNEVNLVIIPAGGQIEGRIVFDVPVGTELATLELHYREDGGVQVPLG